MLIVSQVTLYFPIYVKEKTYSFLFRMNCEKGQYPPPIASQIPNMMGYMKSDFRFWCLLESQNIKNSVKHDTKKAFEPYCNSRNIPFNYVLMSLTLEGKCIAIQGKFYISISHSLTRNTACDAEKTSDNLRNSSH